MGQEIALSLRGTESELTDGHATCSECVSHPLVRKPSKRKFLWQEVREEGVGSWSAHLTAGLAGS